MALDSEAESLTSLSSPSQKFEPRDDDEDTLWEVIEITAEKSEAYKVRWKGNDPKTMRPWPLSWVPKRDCTDDIVMEWRRKKKEKERRKSSAKGRRASTVSKKTARGSTASTAKQPLSKATQRSTSTNTTATVTANRRGRSNATDTRSTRTATPRALDARSKREPEVIDEGESEVEEDPQPSSKQRISTNNARSNGKPLTASGSTSKGPTSNISASKSQPKGKKRKYAEADSAHSSANHASGRAGTVDVEVEHSDVSLSDDDARAKRKKTPVIADRPKKKRKVEVQNVKPETEPSPRASLSQTQSTQSAVKVGRRGSKPSVREEDVSEEEEDDVRKRQLPASDDEEEEEEKMVEDALSEGPPSPPRYVDDDDYDMGPVDDFDYGLNHGAAAGDDEEINVDKEPNGRGKAKAKLVSDNNDEDVEEEEIPADKVQEYSQVDKLDDEEEEDGEIVISNTRGPKKHQKGPEVTSKSKPLSASTTTTAPPAAKFGPPGKKRSLAAIQPTNSPSDKANSKAKDTTKPRTTVKKPRLGPIPPPRVQADSESDSDRPPPMVWFSLSKSSVLARQPREPTEERSVFWEGELEHLPILSPAAKKRLEVFDAEVMGVKKGKGKQKERPTNEKKKEEKKKEQLFLPDASSSPQVAPRSNARSPTPQSEVAARSAEAQSDVIVNADTRSSTSKHSNHSKSSKSRDIAHSKPSSTSAATTIALTKDKTNPPRRPANHPSNSYITDVIPETEAEQSSQSQELKVPTHTDAGQQLPSTPRGNSTLKSRMKPRTPLSRTSSSAALSSNAHINGHIGGPSKQLRPIPMLSPSTFHPLLQPDSSLPESIVEADSEDRRRASNVSGDEDEEAPVSSIEQFDSPEKGPRTLGRKKVLLRKDQAGRDKVRDRERGSGKESASDVWDSEVVKRGQELAEAAKKRNRGSEARSSGSPGPQKKKSVADIIARSRSKSNASRSVAEDEELTAEPEDEDVADASTTVVPPASGPQTMSVEPPSIVQQMEEAYVDLSGGVDETMQDDSGADASNVDPALLRQEEEESTQDLMMELQEAQKQQRGMEDIDVHAGWSVAGPSSAAAAARRSASIPDTNDATGKGSDDGHADDDMRIPEITVQNPSRATSIRSYSPAEEGDSRLGQTTGPMTRSRSRSKTPSVSGQKSTGVEKKKVLNVPAIPSRQGSVEPSVQRSDIKDITSNDAATAHLLEGKTEEISTLETRLSEEQLRNEALQREVLSFREQLQRLVDSQKTQDSDTLKRLTDLKTLLDAEKLQWETERAQLVAAVESAKQRQVSAEQDREFFREQYAKASGYVSSVRNENKDLEQRAQIAEDQAKSGVSLIKATHEGRIKTLQNDLNHSRMVTEFLIKYHQRKDDKDICRRAAEEPELRAQCLRQEKALETTQERIDELEAELEEKGQTLSTSNAELLQWKRETTRLHGELNEALTKLDRIGNAGDENSQGNGHEYVYRCQWRMDRNNEACHEAFLTLSELEQHLFAGGHLQTA